jgi:hypothetical protein
MIGQLTLRGSSRWGRGVRSILATGYAATSFGFADLEFLHQAATTRSATDVGNDGDDQVPETVLGLLVAMLELKRSQ